MRRVYEPEKDTVIVVKKSKRRSPYQIFKRERTVEMPWTEANKSFCMHGKQAATFRHKKGEASGEASPRNQAENLCYQARKLHSRIWREFGKHSEFLQPLMQLFEVPSGLDQGALRDWVLQGRMLFEALQGRVDEIIEEAQKRERAFFAARDTLKKGYDVSNAYRFLCDIPWGEKIPLEDFLETFSGKASAEDLRSWTAEAKLCIEEYEKKISIFRAEREERIRKQKEERELDRVFFQENILVSFLAGLERFKEGDFSAVEEFGWTEFIATPLLRHGLISKEQHRLYEQVEIACFHAGLARENEEEQLDDEHDAVLRRDNTLHDHAVKGQKRKGRKNPKFRKLKPRGTTDPDKRRSWRRNKKRHDDQHA